MEQSKVQEAHRSSVDTAIDQELPISSCSPELAVNVDVLNGDAIAERGRDYISTDATQPEQQKPEGPGAVKNSPPVPKAAAAALALAALAWLIWPATIAVAPTAPGGDIATASGQPNPNQTGPSQTGPAGDAASPIIDIASSGPGVADVQQMHATIEAAVNALPLIDQNCESKSISAYDRAVCGTVGADIYFKCTKHAGRKWGNEIDGCQLVQPGAEMFSHRLAYMNDVLFLSKPAKLAVAGAPDSVIALSLHQHLLDDFGRSVNYVNVNAKKADKTSGYWPMYPEAEIALKPFFLDKEKLRTGAVVNGMPALEDLPAHLQCIIAYTSVDGAAALDLTKCRDWVISGAKLGYANSTAYLNFLRDSVEKIKSDVKRATKFAVSIDTYGWRSQETIQAKGGDFRFLPFIGFSSASGITNDILTFSKQFDINFPGSDRTTLGGNSSEPLSLSPLYFKQIGMSADGTWTHCDQPFHFDSATHLYRNIPITINVINNPFARSASDIESAHVMPSDIRQACVSFTGVQGKNIPVGLIIRDYEQMKKMDAAPAVIVIFANPKLSANRLASESEYQAISGDTNAQGFVRMIDVDVLGYRVIDRWRRTELSAFVDKNAKKVFAKMSPVTCSTILQRTAGYSAADDVITEKCGKASIMYTSHNGATVSVDALAQQLQSLE